MSTKFVREVIRDWLSRKHKEYGSLFVEKGRVSAFLKDKTSWGATPLEQKPAKNFYLNIKQLDALNFIICLFQASTCFEHMC